MPDDSFAQFIKDRNEALLSMDLEKVRAYVKKYGESAPTNDEILLCAIHKARTAITTFPIEERKKSKQWLTERGYQSMDDGEL